MIPNLWFLSSIEDNEQAIYQTVAPMMYEAVASHPGINLMETVAVKTDLNR